MITSLIAAQHSTKLRPLGDSLFWRLRSKPTCKTVAENVAGTGLEALVSPESIRTEVQKKLANLNRAKSVKMAIRRL